MTSFLTNLILFTTNACLTLLSIYWAATAWGALRLAKAELPWALTNCTVLSKSVQQHRHAQRYRPEFVVTNFAEPSPPEEDQSPTGTAYRYGTPYYNETLEDAEEYIARFNVNETYACWQSPTVMTTLSFSPVPYGVRREDVNLAVVSTMLAVAAVLSLCVITYLMCVTPPPPSLEDFLSTQLVAAAVARPGLSQAQINAVMSQAIESDTTHMAQEGEDTGCAICLDEGLGARLPCGHAFHPACIKAWLLRGGEACPLCVTRIEPPPLPAPSGRARRCQGHRATMIGHSAVPAPISRGLQVPRRIGGGAGSGGGRHGQQMRATPLPRAFGRVPSSFFGDDSAVVVSGSSILLSGATVTDMAGDRRDSESRTEVEESCEDVRRDAECCECQECEECQHGRRVRGVGSGSDDGTVSVELSSPESVGTSRAGHG